MTRLLLATSNPGKLPEMRRLVAPLDLELVAPRDLGLELHVPEDGATYADNATAKARAFAVASGLPALAEDSGIEVDALGGGPGPRSGRWVPGSDADRVRALLEALSDVPAARRTARFRAVAALARPDGRLAWAEGCVEGRVATEPRGSGGFGYAPVFVVEDGDEDGTRTIAELDGAAKDRVSHRARAIRALWPALESLAAEGETG